MSDTIEPQEENNALEDGNINEIDGDSECRQGIFDELFQSLMGGFGQACEENGVEVAIAIARHPQIKEPIVFYRGHIVDAASLSADVLRQIKQEIYEQLSTGDIR
jgi:hypothetical protein